MSENTENRQGATPDLSGMLGQLLQNPQAMGQVIQMADTLRRSGGFGTADSDRADGIVQSNDGTSEGNLGGMNNFGGKGESDGNWGSERGGAHGVRSHPPFAGAQALFERRAAGKSGYYHPHHGSARRGGKDGLVPVSG